MRVSAVVLAYSKFDICRDLLASLKDQSRRPDDIIVVFQGEDGEFRSWLRNQRDILLVEQGNQGSAGGFCKGIEVSIGRGNQWTWIFDDDAVPAQDALEELLTRPYASMSSTAFIGSRIVDAKGSTYMSPGGVPASQAWYGTVLEDRCIPATDACWLGLLISTSAVLRAGLPIREFFLWDEDREFVSRLQLVGAGYCALGSVVTHYQSAAMDWHGIDFIKIAYYARNNIARTKIMRVSMLRRLARMVKRCCFFIGLILKGRAPWRLMPWVLSGVFLFWPKVRYLKQDGQGADIADRLQ